MKWNVMMKENQEKEKKTKQVALGRFMYHVRGCSEYFLLNFQSWENCQVHCENYNSHREFFWMYILSLVEPYA